MDAVLGGFDLGLAYPGGAVDDLALEVGMVYDIEVNDADGSAIVNAPVYVGDVWPFLPDFRDLSPRSYDTNALNFPTDLNSRRKLVLDLINVARKRYGVEAVFQDAKLDKLAQDHSQNQINQNFFGHVDPQGRSPSQRAQ